METWGIHFLWKISNHNTYVSYLNMYIVFIFNFLLCILIFSSIWISECWNKLCINHNMYIIMIIVFPWFEFYYIIKISNYWSLFIYNNFNSHCIRIKFLRWVITLERFHTRDFWMSRTQIFKMVFVWLFNEGIRVLTIITS